MHNNDIKHTTQKTIYRVMDLVNAKRLRSFMIPLRQILQDIDDRDIGGYGVIRWKSLGVWDGKCVRFR